MKVKSSPTKVNKYTSVLCALLFPWQCIRAGSIPADNVGEKVSGLWQQRSIAELRAYLVNLEQNYTTYVPAIAASAFYDGVFCGRLKDAQVKLATLKTLVDSTPSKYSDKFRRTLATATREVESEIRIQNEHGRSPQTMQTNANPQAVGNEWSEHALAALDLEVEAPLVEVP